jgi:hypothetical protein
MNSSTLESGTSPLDIWIEFWLRPAHARVAAQLRVALGCVGLFIVGMHWWNWSGLISTGGFLDRDSTLTLLTGRTRFRLSPLFFTDAAWFVNTYFATLFISIVVVIVGIGQRIAPVIAWLLFLGLMHRLPSLQSLADPLMSAGLMYLIIDPGKLSHPLRPGFCDDEQRSTTRLAARLTQLHIGLWMLAALMSHLSGVIWWNGQAVWFLTAADQSYVTTLTQLAESPWIGEALTHGIILTLALAVLGLLSFRFAKVTLIAAVMYWLCIMGVAGEWTYGLAGIALCSVLLRPNEQKLF